MKDIVKLFVAAAVLSAPAFAVRAEDKSPSQDTILACTDAASRSLKHLAAAEQKDGYASRLAEQAQRAESIAVTWHAMGCGEYPELVANYRDQYIAMMGLRRQLPEPSQR